jgi:hypothetical protein
MLLLGESGRVRLRLRPASGPGALRERDGHPGDRPDDRLASILEDARRRGVAVRGTGDEPSWLLEVFDDRIVFVTAFGGEGGCGQALAGPARP